MIVANWMTKRVATVKPLDTILHAREILEDRRVNQLPVVVGEEVVGIITDRDLRDAFPSVFDEAAGSGRSGWASTSVRTSARYESSSRRASRSICCFTLT